MAASINIKADFSPLAEAFRRLAAAGRNLTPAMEAIGNAIVYSTQRRFELGQGPDGKIWPPSIRVLAAGKGQTLVQSHRLEDSITPEASARNVRVGTNVIYAAIHQFGGRIVAKGKALAFKIGRKLILKKSVTIPAREFLGIDREDLGAIDREITAYLAGAVGDAA